MNDQSFPTGHEQSANVVIKNVVCTSCDGFCSVAVKVQDGRVIKVTTRDHPFFKDVICISGCERLFTA